MKCGFVTYYEEGIADFARDAGFDGLELFVNPGTSLDITRMEDADIEALRSDMEARGLSVLTLSVSVNHLAGDEAQRKENQRYFLRAIEKTRRFGTDIITTNAWADPDRSPAENMALYEESFSLYAAAAERHGVRIGIENCPHYTPYPYKVGSIAFSPEMWDAMFRAVPSMAVGLEFDPSHLLWLGVDIPRAIREYGDRIYAFHAKDCEILPEQLYRYGRIGTQFDAKNKWDNGWYRYRVPGLGQVDWKETAKALLDVGFSGPVIIEHEDPVFSGGPSELGLSLGEKTRAGLSYGLAFLRGLPL